MAFSPDGRHLAAAGNDFMVRVWDVTTGQEVRAYQGHSWTVNGVAFSPDGRHLAACSGEQHSPGLGPEDRPGAISP